MSDMFKPISIAFFIAFFVWIGAILFTTKAETRMARACIPVEWSGNGLASITKLVNIDLGLTVDHYGKTWTWGCRYVLWDLFYKNDWMKEQEATQADIRVLEGASAGASKPNK